MKKIHIKVYVDFVLMFLIVTVQCLGGKKSSNACYRIMCVTPSSQAGFHATS